MSTSPNAYLTVSSTGSFQLRNDSDIRISAIDIGSNSIRQTIADVAPTGAIRVVDGMKAAPRLAPASMKRQMSEIAFKRAHHAQPMAALAAARRASERRRGDGSGATQQRDQFLSMLRRNRPHRKGPSCDDERA